MNNEDKILEMLGEVLVEQKSIRKDMEELRQDVTAIKLSQENTIIPSIQLLKEGQITIQNQIKRISVIDSLQDDVATLKSAVKFLSQEVEKLQQAM